MAVAELDHRGQNVDWIDVIGSDWYDEFTVEDIDDTGAPTGPFDLTGCAITARITNPDDTDVAVFTTTIIDAAGGTFSLLVDRATTATKEAGVYQWACAITDANDIKVRWLYGTFTAVEGPPS